MSGCMVWWVGVWVGWWMAHSFDMLTFDFLLKPPQPFTGLFLSKFVWSGLELPQIRLDSKVLDLTPVRIWLGNSVVSIRPNKLNIQNCWSFHFSWRTRGLPHFVLRTFQLETCAELSIVRSRVHSAPTYVLLINAQLNRSARLLNWLWNPYVNTVKPGL